MEKFDAVFITQYQRHYAPLLTSILRTCTRIESVDDDQELYSNDEEDGLKLGDTLLQEVPEDQEVICSRDFILIATVALCMLCYIKNQRSNILQVTTSYFTYVDSTTKRMIENLHCIGFLIIYQTIR